MCIPTPKMPDVEVPATSAPAAPADPSPDMKTDFTDQDTASAKSKKKSMGKKSLRYDAPEKKKFSNGLQISTTSNNMTNLKK